MNLLLALVFSAAPAIIPVRAERMRALTDEESSALNREISSHREDLRRCDEKIVKGETYRFRLVWNVRSDGSVTNVGVDSGAFTHHAFARCLAERLKTWNFPTEFSKLSPLTFSFVVNERPLSGLGLSTVEDGGAGVLSNP